MTLIFKQIIIKGIIYPIPVYTSEKYLINVQIWKIFHFIKAGEKMVVISEVASEKLKEIIAKRENSQNMMLRVALGGFG